MPRIAEILGYIIYFWSNENDEPCYVHVSRKRAVKNATKIWIEDTPRLAHNKSKIPERDLNKIMRWLSTNREIVLDKWNQHFAK